MDFNFRKNFIHPPGVDDYDSPNNNYYNRSNTRGGNHSNYNRQGNSNYSQNLSNQNNFGGRIPPPRHDSIYVKRWTNPPNPNLDRQNDNRNNQGYSQNSQNFQQNQQRNQNAGSFGQSYQQNQPVTQSYQQNPRNIPRNVQNQQNYHQNAQNSNKNHQNRQRSPQGFQSKVQNPQNFQQNQKSFPQPAQKVQQNPQKVQQNPQNLQNQQKVQQNTQQPQKVQQNPQNVQPGPEHPQEVYGGAITSSTTFDFHINRPLNPPVEIKVEPNIRLIDDYHFRKLRPAFIKKFDDIELKCIDFSECGNFTLCSSEKFIKIFKLDEVEPIELPQLTSPDKFGLVKFHKKFRLLHTTSKNCVKYFDFEYNRCTAKFAPGLNEITSLSVMKSSDNIFATAAKNCVKLWDLRKHEMPIFRLANEFNPLVACHPLKSEFAVAFSNVKFRYFIEIFDHKQPDKYLTRYTVGNDENLKWTELKYSDDGKMLMASTTGSVIVVVDAEDGRLMHELKGEKIR